MLDDIGTYALADFVPFDAESYARLCAQHNEAFGPAPAVGLVVGGVVLWAASTGRGRLAAGLLALAWAWVARAWFATSYARLNWAGADLAWFAGLQAALMAFMAWRGWLQPVIDDSGHAITRAIGRATGLSIAVAGFALYPLLDPLLGRPWAGVELFGHSPEPTALVTLGVVLACGRKRLVGMTLPALVCALGGATAWVLGSRGWWVGSAMASLSLIALSVDAIGRRAR